MSPCPPRIKRLSCETPSIRVFEGYGKDRIVSITFPENLIVKKSALDGASSLLSRRMRMLSFCQKQRFNRQEQPETHVVLFKSFSCDGWNMPGSLHGRFRKRGKQRRRVSLSRMPGTKKAPFRRFATAFSASPGLCPPAGRSIPTRDEIRPASETFWPAPPVPGYEFHDSLLSADCVFRKLRYSRDIHTTV